MKRPKNMKQHFHYILGVIKRVLQKDSNSCVRFWVLLNFKRTNYFMINNICSNTNKFKYPLDERERQFDDEKYLMLEV